MPKPLFLRLKGIIENNETSGGRAFDIFIQFLVLVSLVSFSIETLPDLSESAETWLGLIEVVTVIIFSCEYVLRIMVADRKLRFVFSFFGLIDLLAILPFYLASGVDLRSLRILRLMRLVRAFKLARYSKAIERFRRAFLIVREELALFLLIAVFLLFFSAVGIYYFENDAQPKAFGSVFHCLWWALETLTTVGYGDVVPVTTGGKVFTFFVTLIGIGVVAVPAGLVASGLLKAREMADSEKPAKD